MMLITGVARLSPEWHLGHPGPFRPCCASENVCREPRERLSTSAEVRAYFAAHLTPVRFSPKGQPIYAQKNIEKLNVIIRPGV